MNKVLKLTVSGDTITEETIALGLALKIDRGKIELNTNEPLHISVPTAFDTIKICNFFNELMIDSYDNHSVSSIIHPYYDNILMVINIGDPIKVIENMTSETTGN